MDSEARDRLIALPRRRGSFVGVDSDGCVFDSMAVKQVQCFHPAFVSAWGLAAYETEVRACLERVNLRSRHRGQDRFVAFDIAVDAMRDQPALADAPLPDTADLKRWLAAGGPYGNEALAEEAARTGSRSLRRILDWSLAVDEAVRGLDPMPAFDEARAFLGHAAPLADLHVVSSTPVAALESEWSQHGLRPLVRFVCGKDLGTKAQHLRWATEGKGYARRLMIGDAPKDLAAARETGVRFYPILPGRENESWRRLREDLFARFLADGYSEEEERDLVAAFMGVLPPN